MNTLLHNRIIRSKSSQAYTHLPITCVFHMPSPSPHAPAIANTMTKLGLLSQNKRKETAPPCTTTAATMRRYVGTTFTIFPAVSETLAVINANVASTNPIQ